MSSALQPSARTTAIALALFARCLEHGKWPDRVEFTKYLYLLDWAHYRIKGTPATDIRWKFFHYGPWSEDMIPVMDVVQSRFGLGWIDYSTEERDVPHVDEHVERLDLTNESLIAKILNAFSKRDTSAVIDYCYRLTEPMTRAKRGEMLDFSTIAVTGEAPIFASAIKSLPMPQLSAAQEEARKKFRQQSAARRERHQRIKSLMQQEEYLEAMAKLAQQRETSDSPVPKGIQVQLTDDAVQHFDDLRNE